MKHFKFYFPIFFLILIFLFLQAYGFTFEIVYSGGQVRLFWITLSSIIVLAVLFSILLWNLSLRKIVGSRTEELRSQLARIQLTERKLAESEENFRNFFNTIEDLLFVLDADGTILTANDTAAALLDRTKDGLRGKNMRVLYPEDRHEEWVRVLSEVNTGQSVPCDIPLLKEDGRRVPVETRVIRGTWSGRAVAFSVSKDLSAIKESEEKFFKTFHSNAVIMTISTLEEGRFIDVNENFLKTTGYARHEVIGATSRELNIFMDYGQREAAKQEIEKNSFIKNYEITIRARDGKQRYCLTSTDFIRLRNKSYLLSVMNDITELKQTQESLRQSETQLRQVIDLVPHMIFAKDYHGNFILANTTMAGLYGLNREDIVGMNHADLHTDKKEVAAMLMDDREVIETGMNKIIQEESFMDERGIQHWLQVSKLPFQAGDTRAVLGIAIDITERKIAEQKLRDTLDFTNKILSSSPLGLVTYDPDGNCVSANESLLKIIGGSLDEILGQNIHTIGTWRSSGLHDAALRALSEGREMTMETKMTTTFGKEAWLNYYMVPFMSSDKTHLLVMINDITEIKNFEIEILKKSRFQESVNRIFMKMWNCETYPDMAELCLNEAAKLTESEYGFIGEINREGRFDTIAISKTGWDACDFPEPQAAASIANMELKGIWGQVIKGGVSIIENNEENLKIPEGHPPLVSFLGIPLKKGETVFGMIGLAGKKTFYDRHDLKDMELLSYPIVEVLNRKKIELQLSMYMEELRISNRELDDFAYIASHDLKEPLRGIHNYSSFLIEDYADSVDEEGKNKLDTLMRLTTRLEELIDSLLHYSRVGRLDLELNTVDFNDVIKGALESLNYQIRHDKVNVKITGPMPKIRCDKIRMQEVITNLVSNAIKYNDKQEKKVYMGFKTEEGNSGVFFVKDNGIGIKDKHYDSVFRIFKRLHPRDKYGGGTGAGLTIVKKIIERHRGSIWINSKPGKGTTFYFTMGEV